MSTSTAAHALTARGLARAPPAAAGDRLVRRDRGYDREPPAPRRRPVARRLTGAGATFPNPIYTKWFDAYAQETGVRINYQSIGSGGGIRQFTEGTVDFGATDGPMTDEQIAAVQGNVLHVPTVLGAVVRHLQPARARADAAPLRRRRRWPTSSSAGSPSGTTPRLAALNPGVKLPAEDIIVVHRSDGSGTTFIFTDYLSKVSPEWKDKVGQRHLGRVAGRAGRQGQRGRHPAGQAVRGRDRLRRADLRDLQRPALRRREERGRASSSSPSLKSVTRRGRGARLRAGHRLPGVDHQCRRARTPIRSPRSPGCWSSPTAARHAPRARQLRNFLDWMLQPEAQRMAADLHYAPLPVPVIELMQQRIGALKRTFRRDRVRYNAVTSRRGAPG